MKNELNILCNALLYYTRIPVPQRVVCTEQTMSKAFRYLPLMGLLVGGAGGGIFYFTSLLLPTGVAIALTLSCTMLLTGCLHEDGFADFCDGFGAGSSSDAILRIMKDSHIGTYGVLGLILLLSIKGSALYAMPASQIPLILLTAHTVSRVYPVLMVRLSTYVRLEQSKASHARAPIDNITLGICLCIGFCPLIFFPVQFIAWFLLISFVLFILYKKYLHVKIGGFTGDTLGALQQGMEVLLYLVFLALSSQS